MFTAPTIPFSSFGHNQLAAGQGLGQASFRKADFSGLDGPVRNQLEFDSMKTILLRLVSAGAGILVLAVGFGIALEGFLLYSSELHSLTPPPLWKSVLIVGLLTCVVISSGWVAYRMIRYAVVPITRTKMSVLLAVAVLAPLGFWLRSELKQRAQKRREATYQSILHEYTQVLKPGMTRKEVEDYLHTKNAPFLKSNFAESGPNRHSFDDLTKIGEEDAPWYCGEQNVYVAFLFVDHESSPATDFRFKDDDLDTLKSVSLYHWLEDCL